ncbi:hypothetical protein [Erwinia sp. S63]|jgi:hypothetical protein|uniref:hypothetical protein n=1 Tax=Erwinia sp. S63 TaxID=2769341 RepID=UPI00257399CD|nr:hypothetical protein [Erwinia sp. S63]
MSLNNITWGLCAPAKVPSVRRTRTLQLNEIVARFHHRAVPGLGGVWFGRQLMMALQGVASASQMGENVSNIEAANAIEALCCWQGFKENEGKNRDPRLRGIQKIRTLKPDSLTFNAARKRAFYVTIPMRMGTIEALPALGFVQAQRNFNAFQCSPVGEQLVRLETPQMAELKKWISSPDRKPPKFITSPLIPLSQDACLLIRSQLENAGSDEDSKRRRDALQWMDRLRQSPPKPLSWKDRPDEISSVHWHDLQAGAYFFKTQNIALALLDRLESEMAQRAPGPVLPLHQELPLAISDAAEKLRICAQAFLDLQHNDAAANQFCSECTLEPAALLRALVSRDGHILKLKGDLIEPGPAFDSSRSQFYQATDEEEQYAPEASGFWPAEISWRIRNLFRLNLDLHGELADWLKEGNA